MMHTRCVSESFPGDADTHVCNGVVVRFLDDDDITANVLGSEGRSWLHSKHLVE